MNSQESTDITALTTAYTEVCHSYERIDDFRAKLLGFLPLVSGTGLFFLLGRADANGNVELLVPAGIFGFVVTVGLLFYELRGIQRCIRLASTGTAFERQLGVEGRFSQWPHSLGRFINEPIASAFIYSAVLSAWVFLAVFPIYPASVISAIVSAAIVLSIAFGAVWRFYSYITRKEGWQTVADDVWRAHGGQPLEAEKVRAEIEQCLIARGLMDPALKTGGLKKKDKKVFVDMVKSIGKGQRFHVPLAGSLVDWRRRRRKGGVEGGSTTTLETEH